MDNEERSIGSDEDLQEQSSISTGELSREGKRQRRMQQHRERSRISRYRKKQYIEFLEQRAAALSAEVEVLREAVKLAVPGHVDDSFPEAFDFCLQELMRMLADPLTSDQEFDAGFHRYIDLLGACGKSRQATLWRTFETTLEVMFPKEHLFWLWLSQCDPQHAAAIWSEICAPLGLSREQFTLLHRFVTTQESQAVQRTCSNVKETVKTIISQAANLQSILLSLRPMFTQRQGANLALWFQSRYRHLSVEEVLAYGCNSTELLAVDTEKSRQ